MSFECVGGDQLPLRPMTVWLLPNTRLRLARECTAPTRHVCGVGIVFGHPRKITPQVESKQLRRGGLSWRIELDEELVRDQASAARIALRFCVHIGEHSNRVLG